MISSIRAACAAVLVALAIVPTIAGHAQVPSGPAAAPGAALTITADGLFDTTWDAQFESLYNAVVRLPTAALLSAILAFRPRRRGTPIRQAPVIQTQIVLALVGAMVMLVVGSSLARAFGIVGAAGLIRYRANIKDPKDAGVMLSTLAIGLASGVGLYLFAIFATFFVLAVLIVVESIETEPYLLFDLTITAKDSASLKDSIEGVLRRRRIPYELRSTSEEETCYEVKLALGTHTDKASEALMALKSAQPINVKWEQKKDTK